MADLVLIVDNGDSHLISKSSVASVHWDSDYHSTTVIMKERRKRYDGEEPYNQVYHFKIPVDEVIKILTTE
jgi:hypothetical protein